MNETRYIPLGEFTEKIGNTTFVVSSYADSKAVKTSEQLLMQYLESRVLSGNFEMEEAV